MNTLMKKTNSNGNAPATTFSGWVDKVFQDNLNRFFDDTTWGFNNVTRSVHVPVNIRQTDTAYELEVVAPGLKKEDLKMNVNGNVLTISYEHKEEAQQDNKSEGWLRTEYKLQSFSRSFTIDETVDVNKISAEYTDGILYVTLHKKEEAQRMTRVIEIK